MRWAPLYLKTRMLPWYSSCDMLVTIPWQWPEHSDPGDSVMISGCNIQPQWISRSLVKQWVFFKDKDWVGRNFEAAYKQYKKINILQCSNNININTNINNDNIKLSKKFVKWRINRTFMFSVLFLVLFYVLIATLEDVCVWMQKFSPNQLQPVSFQVMCCSYSTVLCLLCLKLYSTDSYAIISDRLIFSLQIK